MDPEVRMRESRGGSVARAVLITVGVLVVLSMGGALLMSWTIGSAMNGIQHMTIPPDQLPTEFAESSPSPVPGVTWEYGVDAWSQLLCSQDRRLSRSLVTLDGYLQTGTPQGSVVAFTELAEYLARSNASDAKSLGDVDAMDPALARAYRLVSADARRTEDLTLAAGAAVRGGSTEARARIKEAWDALMRMDVDLWRSMAEAGHPLVPDDTPEPCLRPLSRLDWSVSPA